MSTTTETTKAPVKRKARTSANGRRQLNMTPDLAGKILDSAAVEARAKKGGATVAQRIVILKPQRTYMRVTVQGDTPIICHNFSAKAQEEMVGKQAAGVRGKKQSRPPRDPKAAYLDSMYFDGRGRPAFPAGAFKKAAVEACTFLDGVTHKRMRGSFFVLGDYLPITGVKPVMRKDVVRVGTFKKVPDIRYRAEFPVGWRVTFDVLYAADVVAAEDVVNVIDRAGFHVGVGDWRPQRDGASGMFHVVDAEAVKR